MTWRPVFATLTERGTRRHRRSVLLAARRAAAAAGRLAPGRRGRQDRADRSERHRQDHADPDHLRRPGGRRRRRHAERWSRRDAPVRRAAARRLDRSRPAAHGGPGQGPRGRGGGRRHRAADDGARHRGGPAGLRPGARRLGRRRWLRVRDALGHLHRRRHRHPLRAGAVPEGDRPCPAASRRRLVLEALLRGPEDVLLLDEPDNYLDVPAKRWLEDQLRGVAEDRALRLARPRAARTASPPGSRPSSPVRPAPRLGAPGPVLDLRAGPPRTGTTASRSCASAGTRSTPSSRRWS